MYQCCFCAETLQSDALALVVMAATRAKDSTAPSQRMWTHAACLAERLAPGVPFDRQALFD